MKAAPVYVYGIVGSRTAPALARVPEGLPDTGPVRVATVATGVHVLLADADAKAWSEEKIGEGLRDMDWVSERALRHDEVLAHFLEAEALIPMKAFTLFTSEASAIQHVKTREKSVRGIATRVGGCVEWGLRLRFDDTAARERQAAAAKAEPPASGAAFLQRKKTLQDAARNARAEAYAAARGCAEKIATIAKETRVIPLPQAAGTTALLLELAYLVPRTKKKATIEAMIEGARAGLASSAVDAELTGPWAPFHFAGEPTPETEGT